MQYVCGNTQDLQHSGKTWKIRGKFEKSGKTQGKILKFTL